MKSNRIDKILEELLEKECDGTGRFKGKNKGKEKRDGSGRISEDDEKYKEFFAGKLKKYGVKDPSELKGAEKKKFFDEVDKEWKAKEETD